MSIYLSTSAFSFFSQKPLFRHFQILQESVVFVYVYTLFHQEICLDSVESLTIPPGFFQLLLAVCQPSLFLPHCPLVIVVNVLQLLIRTLEDLSRKQPSCFSHSFAPSGRIFHVIPEAKRGLVLQRL